MQLFLGYVLYCICQRRRFNCHCGFTFVLCQVAGRKKSALLGTQPLGTQACRCAFTQAPIHQAVHSPSCAFTQVLIHAGDTHAGAVTKRLPPMPRSTHANSLC